MLCHVLCNAQGYLNQPLLCTISASICDFCFNLHFVLWALLEHGYKEANTAFVLAPVHPSLPVHAILYSRLGRKILSGIVVLFSRGREQKSSTMGSVARAEGCSGKRPTFMTTSPPLHQCPDSQLQNNKRRQKATNIHGTLSTVHRNRKNNSIDPKGYCCLAELKVKIKARRSQSSLAVKNE